MAFRRAARPPLEASLSVASPQSGACTIFGMAELARQIDSQVQAASALRAPGRRTLGARGLRLRVARDVDARAPWRSIAEVALAAWTEQAGQAA